MFQVRNVELISVHNREYLINNRRFKQRKNNMFKFKKVNYFASEHTKAIQKWERVVQQLLAMITNEYPERILKYSTDCSFVNYKEVDFIAQPNEGKFVFCELKLKENFKSIMNNKSAGWKQLDKTLSVIAESRYQNARGLAICVDMSYVYGIETEAVSCDYIKYSELSVLFNNTSEKQTLWLNSKDVTTNAIKYGFLTTTDIKIMREVYQSMKDPLSILPPLDKTFTNNPFNALQSLSTSFAS